MLDNVKNTVKTWATEHKDAIVNVVMLGGCVVGIVFVDKLAVATYNKIFDYGYNCRKNLEREAGNGLFEAIEKFGNSNL